jgi:hypothetical protein
LLLGQSGWTFSVIKMGNDLGSKSEHKRLEPRFQPRRRRTIWAALKISITLLCWSELMLAFCEEASAAHVRRAVRPWCDLSRPAPISGEFGTVLD